MEGYWTNIYYMALSHKDWNIPNSRIWLAEMDIDRGIDIFPSRPASRPVTFWSEKLQNKMENHWLFSSNFIYFWKCQKADEKKKKEDEQTVEELNSVHRRSQAK